MDVYADVIQRLLLKYGPNILSLSLRNSLSRSWPPWVIIAGFLEQEKTDGITLFVLKYNRLLPSETGISKEPDFPFSALGDSVATLCELSFNIPRLLRISGFVIGKILEERSILWDNDGREDNYEDLKTAKANIEEIDNFTKKLGDLAQL